MAYIKKGDLVELKGKRWLAVRDDYTKLIRDSESWSTGYDMSTAVGAVLLEPADGEGPQFEAIYSRHGVPKIIESAAQP